MAECRRSRWRGRDGERFRAELHLTQLSITQFWYLVNMLLYDNYSGRHTSSEHGRALAQTWRDRRYVPPFLFAREDEQK
jgi:hypothetical protein